MLRNFSLKMFLFFLILSLQSVFAFEDCVLYGNGKLTDISIENNKIIDVYPLITVMNEKNTLIVHPLQVGKTRFCVLKNGKDKVMFNVVVEENKTIIDEVEGFDILQIDSPPNVYEYDLDMPPITKGDE